MPCECKHLKSLHCRDEPTTSSLRRTTVPKHTAHPTTFMILSNSSTSSSSSRSDAGELISPNIGLIKKTTLRPLWTMTRRFGYGYLSPRRRISRKRPEDADAIAGATRISAAEEASLRGVKSPAGYFQKAFDSVDDVCVSVCVSVCVFVVLCVSVQRCRCPSRSFHDKSFRTHHIIVKYKVIS